MLDLFDAAPVVSSGPVPRVLVAGVVWDEAAEERFQQSCVELRGFLGGKWADPKFAADVEREARWAVEISLHRAFIKARMLEASNAFDPQEKRALVARWQQEYGAERAKELVGLAGDVRFRSLVRKEW